jgi:glycine/D-amino acid oxidase-like deaminating enzyme
MGCGIAYHLARAGRSVLLLERGELNREASGTNAGTIHLQVRRHEDRAPGRLALIEQSASAWREIAAELDEDIDLRLHGGLMVAESDEEIEMLAEKLPLDRSLGLESELLSGGEVHALEPNLSPSVKAATHCPHEGSSNPLLTTHAFARRAKECGAEIRTHSPVTGIECRRDGGFLVRAESRVIESKHVVCAAGAWTSEIAAMAGLKLTVWGCPLSVTVTEAIPPLFNHVIQHIGRKLTMKQTQRGTVLLGGGWLGLDDKEASFDSIAGNAWEGLNLLPALADVRAIRTWTGIIAVTADGLPIVGLHPNAPGLLVAVVPVGSAGYTVAPVVARLAAEALTSGATATFLDEYTPTRAAI